MYSTGMPVCFCMESSERVVAHFFSLIAVLESVSACADKCDGSTAVEPSDSTLAASLRAGPINTRVDSGLSGLSTETECATEDTLSPRDLARDEQHASLSEAPTRESSHSMLNGNAPPVDPVQAAKLGRLYEELRQLQSRPWVS